MAQRPVKTTMLLLLEVTGSLRPELTHHPTSDSVQEKDKDLLSVYNFDFVYARLSLPEKWVKFELGAFFNSLGALILEHIIELMQLGPCKDEINLDLNPFSNHLAKLSTTFSKYPNVQQKQQATTYKVRPKVLGYLWTFKVGMLVFNFNPNWTKESHNKVIR